MVKGNEPAEVDAPRADAPTDEQVDVAVSVFAMLAEPTRVKILWALRDRSEVDVTTLAATAGVGATVASQHLGKLRLAGVVTSRREGRRVLYRIRSGHVRRLLEEALFHADHQVGGYPDHD